MIDPVAVSIGVFPIHWYGVIMALAFLSALIVAYHNAKKAGVNPEHILNIATVAIPSGIIGARLYYVIFQWSQYRENLWEILAVWHGGLAIHGGLLGGITAGYLYVKKQNLSFWGTGDLIAPGIVLAQSIGRWGNFINREAHGGPVSENFINHFPLFIKNQMYINGSYFHPTFLYESLWNFSLFVFLTTRLTRKKFQGEILLIYLGLYSTGRFVIEGLRTDSLMLGHIRVAQLVSLTLIVTAIFLYFYKRFRATKLDV
ncbi:prolipoprotein diacylglyceryl transferase [Desulfofarcimen acetoxidans DSM 771]|uniref:Phosphatidylglycerol--prolipoprotein diacylglyceryl transferase n=1 Tax=Desulfofarcimen acetoxidans (strain ATCC 49208 / DSM 771 / KCTC 5769 / VKM B-1644 / 5575) TaxID=485916 RepID=C8W0D0_DESAS|nr:prolipoprotein diacylglyceryl transferase [Desulfofarcimen acetoxidans]ACV63185.1 prolipoprotein diacylglyceryl transferase [Desulfofarcimen acetoxidans DSM 771]